MARRLHAKGNLYPSPLKELFMPALNLELLEDRLVPAAPVRLATDAAILNIIPTEVGVFRNGTWTLDSNDNHQVDGGDSTFVFGEAGDIPITGDWNADGHTKVGIFRDVNGVGEFVLDTFGHRQYDSTSTVFTFGLGGDTPIVGDWDASGRDRVGVFRGVNGQGLFVFDTLGHQHYDASSTVFNFGSGTDQPVIGDWNGDGISKAGVFRNNGGVGLFLLDANGDHVFDAGDQTFNYGLGTDRPVIGDWSGDTHAKVGVARDHGAGGLVWSLDYNGNFVFDPADLVFAFGSNTAVPVVGKW